MKAEGPRRRLVSFVVGDPELMLWGGELLLRDGVVVGHVTSAAWGETIGSCVGLAYALRVDGEVVRKDYLESGTYEVNVGGIIAPVTISLRPPYDPTSAKVKV